MEALAKMFFGFVNKDPQIKEGIGKSIQFVMTLDQRLRAIEEKVGIQSPPLDGQFLDKVEQQGLNGSAN